MKALCYISGFADNLSKTDIDELIKFVNINNNLKNITGILLIRNKYFFQVLEGENDVVNSLYAKIEKDTRHQALIKVLDTEIKGSIFNAYNSGAFEIIDNYSNVKKLLTYFNWIKNAEYIEAEALMALTNNFLKNSKKAI